MNKRIFSSSILSLASVLAVPAIAAPALQPITDFVSHPAYSTVKISPNGEYLAMTVDKGEQDVLAVLRTRDLSLVKVNQLPDQKSVGSFYWVSPERLMFNSIKKLGGYAQPFNTGEWFAVNADGSQPRPLIFYGTRDATQRSKTVGSERFSLLDTLRNDDQNVIMTATTPRSSEGVGTEVFRVDTLSGRRVSLGRAPKENCSIVLDAAKDPRFAVCSSSRNEEGEYDERSELYRRDGKNWTLVNASKSDGKHLYIVRTSSNGTVYAEQDDGKAPAAAGTLNTSTGEFTPLFQDKVAEISDYIWSTDESTLVGVVTESGAPAVKLLDETHADAEIYASLAAAFEGQMVDLASYTQDGKKIIVNVYSDSNPGELYLYDRDSGKARFLMHRKAELDKNKMASVKPFNFKSRDGKQIYGYLTLPNGSDGKNLPLIVNPHGGPIGPRDNWGFNWEAQLLASRGYAVLQVNYRGSGGFGKAFQDAGHQQWGQGIQNDIIDATQWAIGQGYADKDRVCIYGGSFGGYSSLMAPIRAPGMFKCTFGYVGVYDIDMMFKKGDIPESESGQRFLRRTHGTDTKVWAENSPARRAAEVKIPVYLAAGARDVRTPPEQTELMNKALIAAGNPPEGMIIQSGEMHGFYNVENRVKLYSAMLDFFSRHIGGGVTTGNPSKAD
ncbi:S9 family peptidase [Pseudoxanthomonas mexicana]|uniref:S9 family peptidase n=1 Tax=Pseudoxanthomonas mexicana TaxID=128785 RepID=A0ABX6REC8_PSEMX|nr:S9 family peptidase [Pseudoxanthomonas mexicana]MCP1583616.1 dipeptidyl aminopeptidase/acylaminoacyl peptidase [Pseudoxanthomonas mexicana]QND81482.1 S9 family peptidase [Pseudoxanthomonas mexicana]